MVDLVAAVPVDSDEVRADLVVPAEVRVDLVDPADPAVLAVIVLRPVHPCNTGLRPVRLYIVTARTALTGAVAAAAAV